MNREYIELNDSKETVVDISTVLLFRKVNIYGIDIVFHSGDLLPLKYRLETRRDEDYLRLNNRLTSLI